MKKLFYLDYEIEKNESMMHDLLRIFLMFQVVIGHLVYIALPPLKIQIQNISENYLNIIFSVLFRFGPESAFMFVFLSGYMVAGALIYSLIHRKNINDKSYFYKRIIRIFPLTLLVLIVTFLCDFLTVKIVGDSALNYYEKSQAYNMLDALNLGNFFGNLFFLQPTFSGMFGSNGPLWTLGYLFQYYIIGWILYKIFKINIKFFLIFFIVFLTFMLLWKLEWFLLFLTWITGGLLRNVKFNFSNYSLFGIFGVLIFGCSTFFSGSYSILLVCISSAFLIHYFKGSNFCFSNKNYFRRIANDSFAVYLVHYPLIISIYLILFDNFNFSNFNFLYYVIFSLFSVIGLSLMLIIIEKRILAKI
jgi:peptidoglycan/LPS O-acetylase OafA/YrhL